MSTAVSYTHLHRAVGRFPKISALGMLNVRPTGEQCDLHIRDRRAGQHTDMRLLSQMGQDEPLPVQVQHIGCLLYTSMDKEATPSPTNSMD